MFLDDVVLVSEDRLCFTSNNENLATSKLADHQYVRPVTLEKYTYKSCFNDLAWARVGMVALHDP